MSSARLPVVAGLFYPDDPTELLHDIDSLLDQPDMPRLSEQAPKAIIAPHAGYIYSGPIAATVYQRIRAQRQVIKRVAIFGPSHRLAFSGLAVPDSDVFTTPLGDIPLDKIAIEQLLQLPPHQCLIQCLNQAHSQEHSLEVQLPFLQRILGDFSLIPVVVGDASADDVAAAINCIWNGNDTLVVISSDLSHYHDYTTAQRMDRHTSQAIEGLQVEKIGHQDACGCNPIKGLLQVARQRGLAAETIDLRNSGDTAGDKDRVVGYGAYVFHS